MVTLISKRNHGSYPIGEMDDSEVRNIDIRDDFIKHIKAENDHRVMFQCLINM